MDTTTNKPGYKTSEFWVVIITSVLTWLNHSGVLGSLEIPVAALDSLIPLAITYIIGRTGIKAVASVVSKDSKV